MTAALGLYLHIPFCARRCPYCDFAVHIGGNSDLHARYVAALRDELRGVLSLAARPLTSIFLGGGTPTALSAAQFFEILQTARDAAILAPDCEVSIEANPENLNAAYLRGLKSAGINRLSLGSQSFDDAVLKGLGRAHSAAQIERVVGWARDAGFENISLDLIFGLPTQSRESWRQTLERAAGLQPQHVSCYSLTIEAETVFWKRVEQGKMTPIEADAQADLMRDAQEILGRAGLESYETSNFAQFGFECRHNLNYWRGGDYLACGVGAHGHMSGHRFWNERDTLRYIEKMQLEGTARDGEEWLTSRERLDERIMLGLRLREGLMLQDVAQSLDVEVGLRNSLRQRVSVLSDQGVLSENAGVVRLADEASLLVDAVAERLLR